MEKDDEILYINNRLTAVNICKDVAAVRKLMKRVTVISNSGINTSGVFPAVAKVLASNDFIVKKLAYWYISENADNSDLILLIINTVLKDCEDPNPMLRGLAVKTLINLPAWAVSDYCIQPITSSLSDSSAFVRRAAVLGTVRVHQCQPAVVLEMGWVDILYKMIRDTDPLVVINCLYALSVILENEGGVVVNRNIAHYLLNRTDQFSDHHVVYVIKVLKKYTPVNEDETLDIMNIMDIYLKSNSPSVMLETLEYFLFLIKRMPHLKAELFKRTGEQIYHLLESPNPEVVYMLTEQIQGLLKAGMCLSHWYKVFLCKYNEPTYVKIKKIDVLSHLADPSNVKEILEELKMYCLDVSINKASVYAISLIAQNHSECRRTAINSLLFLLEFHPEDVAEDVMKVLQVLDLSEVENLAETMRTIQKASLVLETEAGKSAFAGLLGKYAEHFENAPYILEGYIEHAIDGASSEMILALLTAGMQLVLKRPAESQYTFSVLLEHCLMLHDVCIRDKALFYYQLLQCSITEVMRIMSVKLKPLSFENKDL